MATKILFLTPYPIGQAPSQRFRFEQYFDILSKRKIKYAIKPFLTQKAWQVFYSGHGLKVALYLLHGYVRRFFHLLNVPFYHYIFIHREASPVGPPIFEWIIAYVLRKKMVFDFDDAIWLPDPDEQDTVKAKLKWKDKVSKICKWSYKVSCGNNYLAEYAKKHNNSVVVNPTTIDTEHLHNPNLFPTPKQDPEIIKPIIGWTGTHSTLQYLNPIIPVIAQLELKFDFTFLVIANVNPNYSLKSFKFLPWDKSSEIEDLMQIDIGVMPLTDDAWSQGKCGFKLLQYMALKIPSLASPVGINTQLINSEDKISGFLCHTHVDWLSKLELLLTNFKTRYRLGKNGRDKVIRNYSVLSNAENFLSLFE